MDLSTQRSTTAGIRPGRRAAMRPLLFLLRRIHRVYKILISPLFGNACRFNPPCSDYALEAVELHGILRGLFLAIKRVVRCHPYCSGGDDPVPRRSQSKEVKR